MSLKKMSVNPDLLLITIIIVSICIASSQPGTIQFLREAMVLLIV